MLKKSILLFDGVCNLCNSSVQFIIERDRAAKINFSSLQSDFSKQKLKQFGLNDSDLDSIVFIDGDQFFTHSSAALEVLKKLGSGWQLFYIFKIIPAPIRDAVYKFVAKNRYRWFGKKESCWIPTPELKGRFLE